MRIYVSANDIKLGLKTVTSNTKCPVARAIRRAGFKNIYVGVRHARTRYAEIILPVQVRNAITNMCSNAGMKPFSFTLNNKQIEILKGK